MSMEQYQLQQQLHQISHLSQLSAFLQHQTVQAHESANEARAECARMEMALGEAKRNYTQLEARSVARTLELEEELRQQAAAFELRYAQQDEILQQEKTAHASTMEMKTVAETQLREASVQVSVNHDKVLKALRVSHEQALISQRVDLQKTHQQVVRVLEAKLASAHQQQKTHDSRVRVLEDKLEKALESNKKLHVDERATRVECDMWRDQCANSESRFLSELAQLDDANKHEMNRVAKLESHLNKTRRALEAALQTNVRFQSRISHLEADVLLMQEGALRITKVSLESDRSWQNKVDMLENLKLDTEPATATATASTDSLETGFTRMIRTLERRISLDRATFRARLLVLLRCIQLVFRHVAYAGDKIPSSSAQLTIIEETLQYVECWYDERKTNKDVDLRLKVQADETDHGIEYTTVTSDGGKTTETSDLSLALSALRQLV